MPNQWYDENQTLIHALENELGTQSTLYYLLISICAAIAWIVYLTYYNSRVVGLILTLILNRFVKYGHIHVGSFSLSVLSGKIMFRDVYLITENYSIRIQLGLAIFRWWRPLTRKKINEDLSHSETRLSIYLDTFVLHVYNRTSVYSRLEQLFGLDRLITGNVAPVHDESVESNGDPSPDENASKCNQTKDWERRQKKKWLWRDLVPVIKIEVTAGRLVFGNYLLPQALSINFGDAHLVYTTKPASTPFDQFLHIIKCKSDNLRVMLVPSPKYTGRVDEPPRCMGDGFVILQSSDVDIYYYQDEPGLVPNTSELVELESGETVHAFPCWGMDVKYGKNTDISYGPWADRQREYLWKFFYPPDYQPILPTQLPQPGQCRVAKSFDFKMSMQNDCTIDILFTKNKETQALHMHCKQGSYLEFSVPYIIDGSGYTTEISGQLMHLDATTSLKFRSLLACETLEFKVLIKYPSTWNEHQDWIVNLTGCKVSGYLVYHIKHYLTDLIDDWSSSSRPDIYHFVPYTWTVNVSFKEFELMTLTNEWNWIDCFGQAPENAHLAVCGETFSLSFKLPYIDYLPKKVALKFSLKGETAVARMYLPETNTSRHLMIAIANSMKLIDSNGHVSRPASKREQKWAKVCSYSDGWIDVWSTPVAMVVITYTYHPIPPSGLDADDFPGTPDGEETILVPVRLVAQRPLRPKSRTKDGWIITDPSEFDPTVLDPDEINVEINIGPSVCYAYGSLVSNFLNLKENYFGDSQKYYDFEGSIPVPREKKSSLSDTCTGLFVGDLGVGQNAKSATDCMLDQRQYRPMHVTVLLTVNNIQAHLVKNCMDGGSPCPTAFADRLVFEMDKRYEETKLQVLLSPAMLITRDCYQRPESHAQLSDGHLALSGLQIRGHAMFSHKDLPLDCETLEYAWLLEVTVGDITGRLTAPQLQNIVEFLQTFVYLFVDPENKLQPAVPYRLCQHMIAQPDCPFAANIIKTQLPESTGRLPSQSVNCEPASPSQPSRFMCPTADELKYRFVRLTIDCIDLYLVESGSALSVQIYPVRLATCSLHSATTQQGISVLVPHVSAKQFVLSVPITDKYGDSDPQSSKVCWLEAGGVGFGPVIVDAALALPTPEQLQFQRNFIALHDQRTRRLSFLWDSSPTAAGCGCIGGCAFFGKNRNGPKVFHPSERDFIEGINVAKVHLCNDGVNIGYGQSLLRQDETVFGLYSRKDRYVPRRSSAAVIRQNAVCDNSLTPKNEIAANEQRLLGFGNAADLLAESRDSVDYRPQTKLSVVDEQDIFLSSSSSKSDSPLSPVLPMKAMMLPQASSTSNLSDSAIAQRRALGHGRTYSYEPPKTFAVEVVGVDAAPAVTTRNHNTSQSSVTNSFGGSRRSSLASPVLRRLSSQNLLLENNAEQCVGSSTISIVSSDNFFSANENAASSITSMASSLHGAGQMPSSPTSDDLTCSSVYDYAIESPTIIKGAESTTDVESYVSAVEEQDLTKPLGMHSVSVLSRDTSDDDDVATYAAEDECAEESFDTDATQVPAGPRYVDLHGQINQPITKSPLLMSCYANHMTQLQCSNWSARSPMLSQHQGSSLASAGILWIPRFEYIGKGFLPELMVERPSARMTTSGGSPSPPAAFGSSRKEFASSSAKAAPSADSANVDPFTYEGHIKKTTAVVNLKGAVDIMISPLMLEALQRYLESVTPILAALHPSTIINSLHYQCTSAVEKQNKLKAAQQKRNHTLTSPDIGSGGKKKESDSKEQRRFGKKQMNRESVPEKAAAVNPADVELGKCQMSRLQIILSLSKINVCVLQASMVEEVISIAALDRARELTCVSVLAASINHITLQLLTSSITKSIDTVSAWTDDTPTGQAATGAFSSQISGGRVIDGDGNAPTDAEIHRDDIVGSLDISSIHLQMRRMKKFSNFSDQVFLTAIPENRSKAYFTFRTPEDNQDQVSPAMASSASNTTSSRKSSPGDTVSNSVVEDIAGFIMFECGLENICVQVARRKGYSTKQRPESTSAAASPVNVESSTVRTSGCQEYLAPHCAADKSEVYATGVDGRGQDHSPVIDSRSLHSLISGNAADDEDSSHHSESSHPIDSQAGGGFGQLPSADDMASPAERLSGDAASGVLQFRMVWFNFAAPPPSPRKRRLEYTRNDWNLLSTATPAINSWMNPCHRALQASNTLYSRLNSRICCVMACIMTDALEMQSIHMPVKSKYSKITDLSRTLQEDPSCQLLTVLRRYVHSVGVETIEKSLAADTVPQMLTVKKGLLVLTRQWKNILYMPMLASSNFKTKKKLVTFAVPMDNSSNPIPATSSLRGAVVPDDNDPVFDSYDVVDECTSLLRAEGGQVGSVNLQVADAASACDDVVGALGQAQGQTNYEQRAVTPGAAIADARRDSLQSTISSSSDAEWVDAGEERALTNNSPSVTPPMRSSLSRHLTEIGEQTNYGQDLGNVKGTVSAGLHPSRNDISHWRQEQQDMTTSRLWQKTATSGFSLIRSRPPSVSHDSCTLTGLSEISQDDSTDVEQRRFATAMAHPSFQQADAQVLFSPLLAAMGLESARMSALMKDLGGSLSLRGSLSSVRVEIIDSDFECGSQRSADFLKSKHKPSAHFHVNKEQQTPAFVCDSFSVQLSTRDIDKSLDRLPPADANATDATSKDDATNRSNAANEFDEKSRRRRSVRALHAAFGRMTEDELHSSVTTRVDFVVSCEAVTQHVNMSLLRLTHQFVTMVENINKTKSELQESAAVQSSLMKTHSSIWTFPDAHHTVTVPRITSLSEPSHNKNRSSSASAQRPGTLPGVHVSRAKPELAQATPSFTMSVDTDITANVVGEGSSPAVAEERTIVDEIRENTPKCWCTLYHLLDLYSTMPELKTVNRSQLSVIEEEQSIPTNGLKKGNTGTFRNDETIERQPLLQSARSTTRSPKKQYPVGTFTQSVVIGEKVPFLLFGVARVRRVTILAHLSGLKLEAELQNGQASFAHREKVKGIVQRKSRDSSFSLNVGHTRIVLLEGVAPTMQTVVTVNIGKSQGLYSVVMKRLSKHNSGLLHVGQIEVDIPQHPVALHGMVARSSKRLSTTLQEFIRLPSSMKHKSMDIPDGGKSSNRLLKRTPSSLTGTNLAVPHSLSTRQTPVNRSSGQTTTVLAPAITPASPAENMAPAAISSKSVVINFKAQLDGLAVGASILPSLRAQYKIGKVTSAGVTGNMAQFSVNLPTHSLSFSSKMQSEHYDGHSPSNARKRATDKREAPTTPGNLPSSASIDMPPVKIYAKFLQHDVAVNTNLDAGRSFDGLSDGLTVCDGNYLQATADVGAFEHILTTDLLNHLVFVQKVFMKEVNELVQKVSGADQPVPFWLDDTSQGRTRTPLLYSFLFRLKGIQITATTPTNNAVRLETGVIQLELSNRVQRAAAAHATRTGVNAGQTAASSKLILPKELKVFVRAQVDLNLALGTLLKNPMFEEAEAEFQHLASFQTRITLRNALQDEMIPGVSKDQEALLIALQRPVIFVLPAAFDKAVLVWLNYKNAYEYWAEQRKALSQEVQLTTHLFKLPLGGLQQPPLQTERGTLFLQLTVDDLGICLPMNQPSQVLSAANKIEAEPGAALVLTLESTQISACSFGSLVSKGKFTGFCLRFADDFQVTWDDWKPDKKQCDVVMNALVVPHGTYEVCSRTINPRVVANDQYSSNAKWILSIQWMMCGIDIHLDTNIGKRLSAIGSTLTMLAGDQFDGYDEADAVVDGRLLAPSVIVEPPSRKPSSVAVKSDILPDFVYDATLDPKTRARLIENEMNEQAKLVQDLHQLQASRNTIEVEERKLHDLQAALFHDFRQDILKRLKRQSVRASAIKDQLGLGGKPSHTRSHSTGIALTPVASQTSRDGRVPLRHMQSYKPEHHTPRLSSHSRTQSVDVADIQTAPVSRHAFRYPSRYPAVPYKNTSLSFMEEDSYMENPSPTSPHGVEPALFSPVLPTNADTALSASSSVSDVSDTQPVVLRHFIASKTTALDDQPEKASISSVLNQSGGSASLGGAVGKSAQKEPSVDFELDVKVDIESGKCTLHPKEPKADMDPEPRRVSKGHTSSPRMGERKKSALGKKFSMDMTLMSSSRSQSASNETVFIIPAVDVKVHYSSRTGPLHGEGCESPTATVSQSAKLNVPADGAANATVDEASVFMPDSSVNSSVNIKKNSVKKANLYAWLSLPTLPKEMLISPALLDFLEQAIEPIPVKSLTAVSSTSKTFKTANASRSEVEIESSATSLVSSSNYAYASFPVDVVVYIRIQPSQIRFTCLPVSRVECLLRLPSVDVVFASKKVEINASAVTDETSPANFKTKQGRRSGGFSRASSSNIRSRIASGVPANAAAMDGGISVTGSLSNFSLIVFHPYGGGTSGTRKQATAREGSFHKTTATNRKDDEEKTGMPALDIERKNSLSLEVEFVKVNISRSRKGLVPVELLSVGSTNLSSSTSQSGHGGRCCDSQTANVVRFSAVCDIGSAVFKYDMRRLLEILALPKAWYRRSLARRMFLGEELAVPESPSLSDDEMNLSSSQSESSLFNPYEKDSDASQAFSSSGKEHDSSRMIPQLGSQEKLNRPVPASGATKANFDPQVLAANIGAQVSGKSVRNWETLVLFAVSLSQLDVTVNMSNVMGNTVWSTKDLKSQGRLSIDSSGYRNMKIVAGLGSSRLDARGGIIGGNIELQKLESEVCISEDPGKEPEHMVNIKLHAMEAKLDYMGSSILMGRISDLAVKMSDEWHVDANKLDDRRASVATSRSVLVFVHGDLTWDRFHLMISRSTTPELIKMIHKLDEFITQQQTSSKRALSVLATMTSTSKPSKQKLKDDDSSWISEIRHHRHWQKVLQLMGGSRMAMLGCTLPNHGTVIGGTMSLQGHNIALACFHGINFRSKSWAVFNMDEPYICFATEAADVIEEGRPATHVVQNLSFQLGHNEREMIAEKKSMAMVCKLSRGHYQPPPFISVQDWFHYAFNTSEIKDLDAFPVMTRQETERSRRSADNPHDTEVIFVLPSFQMHLKTDHMQGEHEPNDNDNKPVVVCSFVTEFEDHIFVAMDAEAVLFIHDLVMNYVKEKDRGAVARGQKSPEAETKQKLEDPTSVLKQDFREFDCRTWHLEPTVRLLSWAGKRIDPVGVDYILQKLGFQHARLTIPKWMQRGAMDPLDKIISVLVHKLISALREQDDDIDVTNDNNR